MFPLFIPSYHRPDKLLTVELFLAHGWSPKMIYVVVDDEGGDEAEYRAACERYGVNLRVFCLAEARAKHDFVFRQFAGRRSVGVARNWFPELARAEGFDRYFVIDDDTRNLDIFHHGVRYAISLPSAATPKRGELVERVVEAVFGFMRERHIGHFGLSQTGEIFGGCTSILLRKKVMNFSFYDLEYMHGGERGFLDIDTSQFAGMYNEGLFCGSFGSGLVLCQTPAATSPGGSTEMYQSARMIVQALEVPIQFPSAVYAEHQKMNGGRIHHHIVNKYLMPRLLKVPGGRGNIAWDTYPEDVPFTNQPKRKGVLCD